MEFQPDGLRAEWTAERDLLELAEARGVGIESLCGGRGSCTKCKVLVRKGSGSLSGLSELESRRLSVEEILAGYRLSCQVGYVTEGRVVVEVPSQSRKSVQRLQTSGFTPPFRLEPVVAQFYLELEEPSFDDTRSDEERLLDALEQRLRSRPFMSLRALQSLPSVLREGSWRVTSTLWQKGEVLAAEPGRATGPCLGMALDIGSTKIAGYLLDLSTGRILSTVSRPNPQIPFGEDVMSRISVSMEEKGGLEAMHRAVITVINDMIREACERASVQAKRILNVAVVGNTVMHHIFLKIPPDNVAHAPYVPATRRILDIKASSLGIDVGEEAYLTVPPVLAAFIGSDALAGVVATELHKARQLSMLVDVGTNTEVVAGTASKLVACSCPSGPAFEGAQIRHGMRASTGAIERVSIDPETFEVDYRTIDGAAPRGICGSAMIDILAEMLKNGIVDQGGKIDVKNPSPRVRIVNGQPELVLVKGSETAAGQDIVMTQNDIGQIQLAKAAIYTGTILLLRALGKRPSDIAKLYIAGAFGNYIAPESALTIGMYPDIPLERVSFVGNTAGSGARLALLSRQKRGLMEHLTKKIVHIQLAREPDFSREFAKAMLLPHKDLDQFPTIRHMVKTVG